VLCELGLVFVPAGAYDRPVDDFNCSVCMRRVYLEAPFGDDRSGGHIPLTFPNEMPVEVWVHHRGLENPRLPRRRSQVSRAAGRLVPPVPRFAADEEP
jgi:hypothetical protein